jgi:hypothetical protein
LGIVVADAPDFMGVVVRDRAIVRDEEQRFDMPFLNLQRLARNAVDIMHGDGWMQDQAQRE